MPNVSNIQLKEQLEGLSSRLEEAIKILTSSTEAAKTDITQKIDGINVRLDNYEVQLNKLERSIQHTDNRVGDIIVQVEDSNQKFLSLSNRVKDLEEKLALLEGLPAKVEHLEDVPDKVSQLAELVEERTNRQLRETLIFRNIPEEEGESSYKATKDLLAKVIHQHTNIGYEYVLGQIKRTHRERNRSYDDTTYM